MKSISCVIAGLVFSLAIFTAGSTGVPQAFGADLDDRPPIPANCPSIPETGTWTYDSGYAHILRLDIRSHCAGQTGILAVFFRRIIGQLTLRCPTNPSRLCAVLLVMKRESAGSLSGDGRRYHVDTVLLSDGRMRVSISYAYGTTDYSYSTTLRRR